MLYFSKGWISLILSIIVFIYTIGYSKTMGYSLSPFITKYRYDSGGFMALFFCVGLFFMLFIVFTLLFIVSEIQNLYIWLIEIISLSYCQK